MSTPPSTPATSGGATPAPASGGAAKKVIGMLVGVILGVMGPGIVLAALGHAAVLNTWILAALGGWMVGMFVGRQLGLLLAIGLGIFLTLGYAFAFNPWLAGAVVGCAAAVYGTTARWGVSGRLVTGMVILAFTVAQPTPILTDAGVWPNAALTGLVGLLAALWGLLLGRLMGKSTPKPPVDPLPAQQVPYFAWTLAIVLGTATWFVSFLQWQHGGAWFLLFVDFSGKRPSLVGATTGEIVTVELFVGVLGASGLIYAEATPSQELPHWVTAHVRMLAYFQGSTGHLGARQPEERRHDGESVRPRHQSHVCRARAPLRRGGDPGAGGDADR